jgi:hypothetical protein
MHSCAFRTFKRKKKEVKKRIAEEDKEGEGEMQ